MKSNLPTGFKIGFAIWTLICLALFVVSVAVAWHFIAKYW